MRTLIRFRNQCDKEGNGRACYDYCRAIWSTSEIRDRKKARYYFARGCELKYQYACKVAADHAVVTKYAHLKTGNRAGKNICFSAKEMDTAHFTSNSISPSVVMGQRIDSIKPESFWAKAGLEDNDVLVKVNNLPLNSLDEMKKAFGAAGKRFGFEVRRDQDTETIFYDCQ
jgi:hypothetical protein